jgi:dual specificity MAP kinase phosphatase
LQKRREKPPSRVRVYRIAPHCAEAPRYFVPRLVSPPPGRTYLDVRALDPRGCFLVHTPKHLFVWVGKGCLEWLMEAGHRAAALLQKYENAPAPIQVAQGGLELSDIVQPPSCPAATPQPWLV